MMENNSKRVGVEMNFHASVASAVGQNDGIVIVNTTEQNQTLAEAAVEIQNLLRQLEIENPQATEWEQIDYIDAKACPTLRERTIGALRSGGESAIDQFILENKYLKVAKAVTKGWLNPS
jgi:hypothetical protein